MLHREVEVSLNVAHARPRVVSKQANEVQSALCHLGILHVVRTCLWQVVIELFLNTLIQSDADRALEKIS